MFQLQTKIGETLPISLVLLSDGKRGWAVFIKTQRFTTVVDMSESLQDITAIFDEDGFTIGDEEYHYNFAYNYKEIPEMLQWLQKQNLNKPEF